MVDDVYVIYKLMPDGGFEPQTHEAHGHSPEQALEKRASSYASVYQDGYYVVINRRTSRGKLLRMAPPPPPARIVTPIRPEELP